MDAIERIEVSSSWMPSKTLRSMLAVTIRPDREYRPFSDYNATSLITLTQPPSPDKNEACCIFVNVSKLPCSVISEVELVSGCRTIELYTSNGDEYITTRRGTLRGKLDDGTSLYSCQVSFSPIPEISLKLLSLRGRRTVSLVNLHLTLCAGRKEPSSLIPASASLEDLNQLASSASLQNAPPFVKLLVSSLQSYAANKEKEPLMSNLSQNSTVPPELSQMMTAFRQLQPTQEQDDTSKSQEVKDEQNSVEISEDVAVLVECKMSEMEKRLLEYIDSKFVNFQIQMDSMFETVLSKVDSRLSNHHTDVINDEQLD